MKKDRLPSGWKRRAKAIYCSDCWREMFVLRAVTIPVVSPLDCTWEEFGKRLREQWKLVTQASNWMLTTLYSRDDRSRDTGKLKPMPGGDAMYLYPETREMFPALPTQTCAALEQAIKKKYRAKRYEVIWTCSASLPTYRYPSPFPVPGQGWSVEMESGQPIVSARVGGDDRVRFRLRSGHQFFRQLAAVKQIVSGEAEQGQMDLYRQGKSVMCKMVAWLPRTVAATRADGTLLVRTDAESLIVALNTKDEKLWTYNGDQAKRWVAEHKRMLQRLSDDTKAEKRPVAPFAARREAAARKYRDRMGSITHQVSAMIAGYAQRRKFAIVQYDDTLKEFCPELPWFSLRAKLADKLNALGIAFEPVKEVAATEETLAPPEE